MSDLLKDITISIELLEDGYQHNLSEEWHSAVMRDGATNLTDAAREIVKLRKALEFYADVSKYPAPFTGGMGDLWADCGNVARKALT